MKDEEQNILKELGLSDDDIRQSLDEKQDAIAPSLHPALAVGLGTAFVLNLALLLSLPPVLRGRGAPYLPTFRKNMNAMFVQLRNDPVFLQKQKEGSKKLTFVDLGSGDGRLVFRASQENDVFSKCIGYEINPLLHIYASLQRLIRGPKTWSLTQFYMRDIWKVDLRNADVVAVYGLAPIMKDLGLKLKNELRPGSYVLSNVFTIPGWKPSNSSTDGTFIYRIPDVLMDDGTATEPLKK